MRVSPKILRRPGFQRSWAAFFWLRLALPAFAASPLASRGQPLVEVIAALEARGLTIIYSSELLDSSMTVRDEPQASDPVEILREVLEPWGLGIAPGPHDALYLFRRFVELLEASRC